MSWRRSLLRSQAGSKSSRLLFLQSSSIEKLHPKKGTWQRVNIRMTGRPGVSVTLSYTLGTSSRQHEIPFWVDKRRQARAKEVMSVNGGTDESIGFELIRGNGKAIVFRAATSQEASEWVSKIKDALAGHVTGGGAASGADRKDDDVGKSKEFTRRLLELAAEFHDFDLIEKQLVKDFGLKTVRLHAAEIQQIRQTQEMLHNRGVKAPTVSDRQDAWKRASTAATAKMNRKVAIAGYLFKRPRSSMFANFQTWQRRWVVVNWGNFKNDREMPHARIDYFEDKEMENFKRAISLTAASSVKKTDEFGGDHEFICYARGGEAFCLRADTAADRDRWIQQLESVIATLNQEQDRRVRHAEFVSEVKVRFQGRERLRDDTSRRQRRTTNQSEATKKRERKPSDRFGRRGSSLAFTPPRRNSSFSAVLGMDLAEGEDSDGGRVVDDEEITMAKLPMALKRFVILDAKIEKKGNNSGPFTERDVTLTTEYLSYSAASTMGSKLSNSLQQKGFRRVSLVRIASVEANVPEEPLAFALRLSSKNALLFRARTAAQHHQWTRVLRRIHRTNSRLLGRAVFHEGWLTKRARAMPFNWNRRFFRLYVPTEDSGCEMSKTESVRSDLAMMVIGGVRTVATALARSGSGGEVANAASSKVDDGKNRRGMSPLPASAQEGEVDDEESDSGFDSDTSEHHHDGAAMTEAKLTYFSDNITMIPTNTVRLCRRSRVEKKDPSQLEGKSFAFVVKTGLGTPDFCVHADSEEEREAWIRKIVSMVQRLDQPAWLREWSRMSPKERKQSVARRFREATVFDGRRPTTREEWFEVTHSALSDVDVLTRECVRNRTAGAAEPDVLLKHVKYYHEHLCKAPFVSEFFVESRIRYKKMCDELGAETEEDTRMGMLELQNRYLRVMLGALSHCGGTRGALRLHDVSKRDGDVDDIDADLPPPPPVQLSTLKAGYAEQLSREGRLVGSAFRKLWHVVRAGRLEWYETEDTKEMKSFVFLRGFTIEVGKDDRTFTLIRPPKSTWQRNVRIRVKSAADKKTWIRACRDGVRMANAAGLEDATDSSVDDFVKKKKTKSANDDEDSDEDDVHVIESHEKASEIEMAAKFGVHVGRLAHGMVLLESIHSRVVLRNIREMSEDLIAKMTDKQIASGREREEAGLYWYESKRDDDIVHTIVVKKLLAYLKEAMTTVGCCSSRLKGLVLQHCMDEATRYQERLTKLLCRTPIVDVEK
eukprot:g1471.t1